MIRHALRATPWWTLGVAAVLLTVLLRVVQQWPYAMWPLQGIAVGVLAASATWPFDEPAASVVDSLPRGLAWRTAARAAGVVVLVVWWLLLVHWTESAYFGHARSVAWQGCACVVAAVAFVSWRRHQGAATPARGTASAVVAGAAFLALARPLDESLPVFPYTATGPWPTSALLWSLVAAAGSGVLLAALLDVRRHTRVRPEAVGPSRDCPPRRSRAAG